MASVIAHLSLVALVVFATDVLPFSSPMEPIAVNIVTTEEAEPEKPQPEQRSEQKPAEPVQPALPEPSVPTQQSPPASKAPTPPAAPAASAAQPPPTPQATRPDRQAAAAPPPAQLGSTAAGYRPPEPDLSVKYNVMLGLPPELPPPATKPARSDEGFDVTTRPADISSSIIEDFRRHLKTCSKLPASVQPSDHIMVKLRVFMTQDGRLAADPVIGGGSANIKAIEMLQSAIAALKQCQPYRMLPADRYGEWKVLDLDFTPKDF